MGQLVVNGLALGSIYALVALGLLLIFNTVQIVNFAQGQLLMLGAFIGISCAVTHELPVAMAWAVTMVAMAMVGLVFMVLVYFPLRGRPAFLVILTTIAMGIVLENLALIIWGPLPVSLPSPVQRATAALRRRGHLDASAFHLRDARGDFAAAVSVPDQNPVRNPDAGDRAGSAYGPAGRHSR